MTTRNVSIPTFDAMMLPTLRALQQLGGSATIDEIYQTVVDQLQLSNDVLDVPHGNTSQNEVEYRLAWSRTYLKAFGLLENSARGVWSLSSTIGDLDRIDPKEIVRYVREQRRTKADAKSADVPDNVNAVDAPDAIAKTPAWDEQLHQLLLSLPPVTFERLAQRLLRESGFIQVEVTGKSGDGGIDGIGIARIAGFLSFHVLFQCKRYQGSISPSQIRDFRGAMQGRTDKGLFITTGTFSREAVKEATRDGAPPIDLIDGEQLVQRLKDLGLGVKVRTIEVVDVDAEWFAHL